MLSDSPPDRDLEWTDAGVDGAWRYLNRLWRLVARARAGPAGRMAPPASSAPDGTALKRLVHRTIAQVTGELERLHFNKAVALVRELSNAVEAVRAGDRRRPGAAARGAGDDRRPARADGAASGRGAVAALWATSGCWSRRAWPEADPAWLVADTVIVAGPGQRQAAGGARAAARLPRGRGRGAGAGRCRRAARDGGQAAAPRGRGAGQDRECRRLTPARAGSLLAGVAGARRPATCGRSTAAQEASEVVPDLAAIEVNAALRPARPVSARLPARRVQSRRACPSRPPTSSTSCCARQSNALAIQLDNTATRVNLILGASFTLTRTSDGAVLYNSAIRRVVSYNIRSDPFATLIAEQDAERRAAREVARADPHHALALFRGPAA